MEIGKIKEKISNINSELFCLSCKDHMDNADFDYERALESEKAELEKKLKELEGK